LQNDRDLSAAVVGELAVVEPAKRLTKGANLAG